MNHCIAVSRNGAFGLTDINIIQFGASCAQTRPAILAAAKLNSNQAGLPPFAPLVAARIRTPIVGQRFLNRTLVPIKLAPPQNWLVSMYTVNIQRKDNRGRSILLVVSGVRTR